MNILFYVKKYNTSKKRKVKKACMHQIKRFMLMYDLNSMAQIDDYIEDMLYAIDDYYWAKNWA